MKELGGFEREYIKLNEDSRNFRIFGPDETASNRLTRFLKKQPKLNAENKDGDEFLSAKAGSWIPCFPSICARGGWKDIFSPGGTASSAVTKPSSV
jgi:hypothetical protein